MSQKNFNWEDDDFWVEKKNSELVREMYAHMAIGFGVGIVFTITAQYAILWVLNVL